MNSQLSSKLTPFDNISQVSPIECRRKSLHSHHRPLRSRSLRRQSESIPCGLVVRFCHRYPRSKQCGSPRKSTTSLVRESYTGSASKAQQDDSSITYTHQIIMSTHTIYNEYTYICQQRLAIILRCSQKLCINKKNYCQINIYYNYWYLFALSLCPGIEIIIMKCNNNPNRLKCK